MQTASYSINKNLFIYKLYIGLDISKTNINLVVIKHIICAKHHIKLFHLPLQLSNEIDILFCIFLWVYALILLNTYVPRVELRDHVIILIFLYFEKLSYCFPFKLYCVFTFPPALHKYSVFPTSLSTLDIFFVLVISICWV